jgi:hypothetical protein
MTFSSEYKVVAKPDRLYVDLEPKGTYELKPISFDLLGQTLLGTKEQAPYALMEVKEADQTGKEHEYIRMCIDLTGWKQAEIDSSIKLSLDQTSEGHQIVVEASREEPPKFGKTVVLYETRTVCTRVKICPPPLDLTRYRFLPAASSGEDWRDESFHNNPRLETQDGRATIDWKLRPLAAPKQSPGGPSA